MRNKKGIAQVLAPLMRPQVLIVLLIIILIYIGFNYTGSLINVGSDPEVKQIIWNGIPVELTAPTFDSITSGESTPFCNDNDGDVTASNTYDANNNLILKTDISNSQGNCGANYIKATMTLPKGTLSGNCKYGFSLSDSGELDDVRCKIIPLDYSSGISNVKTNQGLGGWYEGFVCGERGCSLQCPGTYCPLDSKYKDILALEYEYFIEKPTEIEVWVLADVGEGGGHAQIELNFVQSQDVAETKTVECLSNIECSSICGSDKIPTCENGLCKCDGLSVKTDVKKISWIDKFNAWLENLFNKLMFWRS